LHPDTKLTNLKFYSPGLQLITYLYKLF